MSKDLTGAWFDPAKPGNGLTYFGEEGKGYGAVYLVDPVKNWYIIQPDPSSEIIGGHIAYDPIKDKETGEVKTGNVAGTCIVQQNSDGSVFIALNVAHPGPVFSPPPPPVQWVVERAAKVLAPITVVD